MAAKAPAVRSWYRRNALGRRIFEMQRLARMQQREDGMRGDRRLGEAGEDQLQLAGIGGDVADGEDAGRAGSARWPDRRRRGCARGSGPSRRSGPGSATGRRTAAARRPRAAASPPSRSATITAASWPSAPLQAVQLVGDHHLDASRLGQRPHPAHALRRGAELVAAVHDADLRRHLGQRRAPSRPPNRRRRRSPRAGRGSPRGGSTRYGRHARWPPLEASMPVERRPVRPEGADPGGDDHRRAASMRVAARVVTRQAACRLGASAVTCWPRWKTGLNGAACSSSLSIRSAPRMRDSRECRRSAFPDRARVHWPPAASSASITWQLHLQHAAFEDGEQADRAGADDRDVGRSARWSWKLRRRRWSHRRRSEAPIARPAAWRSSARGRPAAARSSPIGRLGRPAARPADEAATAARSPRRSRRLARAGDVLALGATSAPARPSSPAPSSAPAAGRDEEVPSPTFTLVQIYDTADPAGAAVWHFDLYRLDDARGGAGARHRGGVRRGHRLIEWPERLGPLLPDRPARP